MSHAIMEKKTAKMELTGSFLPKKEWDSFGLMKAAYNLQTKTESLRLLRSF